MQQHEGYILCCISPIWLLIAATFVVEIFVVTFNSFCGHVLFLLIPCVVTLVVTAGPKNTLIRLLNVATFESKVTPGLCGFTICHTPRIADYKACSLCYMFHMAHVCMT